MRRVIIKTIALVTAVVMCTGILWVPAAFAEEAAAVSNDDALHAMEILRLLDIIPEDYYDYNVDMNVGVTRADVASAVAALIKMKDAKSSGVYYYDVPETHWAYHAIGVLTEQGVLIGREDKLFRPDDLIEKNELCKLLLVVLGYQDMAEYNGGYPSGYLTVARRIDLMTGVSEGETVTRKDMFLILYDALTQEMQEPVVFGNQSTEYRSSEDRTLLSVYRNIYRGEGVVRGVDGMTLDGGVLDAGCGQIEDTVYDTETSLTEYLGQKIEFFYRQTRQSDQKCILWVGTVKGGRTLTITANYDASFDRTSYTLSYYADNSNRQRIVTLDRNITVVYNGNVVGSEISEIFNLPRYTARLVDDGSGTYTTAVVWAYDNFVIDAINSSEKSVYDKVDSSKKLILDEGLYEHLSIRISQQGTMNFSDLQQGNVLSAYLSRDKKYLTVQVSTNKVSGIVDSIREEDHGYVLAVNAVEYYMPKNNQTALKPGDSVTLYLDAAGEAAAYTMASGNEAYASAFLIKGTAEKNGFGTIIRLKVLQSSGSVNTLECADRLKIDGISYKSQEMDKAFAQLQKNGQFVPQFVMIQTNENGQITMIDTVKLSAEEDPAHSLSVSVPYQDGLRYKSVGVLGAKSVLDAKTIVFAVPADDQIATAEDDDFLVSTRSVLMNDEIVNAETYKITDRIGYEQFVLLKNFTGRYTTELPVLVQDVAETLNEDGVLVECLVGYQGNNAVSIAADEDVSFKENDVQPGMVIRIQKNMRTGKLENFEILYDYRKPEDYTPLANTNAAYRAAGGYVHDLVDGVVSMGYTDPSVIDQVMYSDKVPVLIYNTQMTHDNIRTGSINEAKTYRNAGGDCSRILLVTRYTTPVLWVIYE